MDYRIFSFHSLGGILPKLPSYPSLPRQSCLNLSLDQEVSHGKFDDASYYRNQMHNEQTDKDCCLYKQKIPASIPYTHTQCEKVTVEGG